MHSAFPQPEILLTTNDGREGVDPVLTDSMDITPEPNKRLPHTTNGKEKIIHELALRLLATRGALSIIPSWYLVGVDIKTSADNVVR